MSNHSSDLCSANETFVHASWQAFLFASVARDANFRQRRICAWTGALQQCIITLKGDKNNNRAHYEKWIISAINITSFHTAPRMQNGGERWKSNRCRSKMKILCVQVAVDTHTPTKKPLNCTSTSRRTVPRVWCDPPPLPSHRSFCVFVAAVCWVPPGS